MLGLFFAAVFIALNGFFVAAEFALVKVSHDARRTRRRRAREDPRIARARAIVSRIDRYLSVTQFGITLASLGLGWIGEPALERAGRQRVRVGPRARARAGRAHRRRSRIAFALLTFAHVLFGELVPKLVAIQRSEKRRALRRRRRSRSSTSSSGRCSGSSSARRALILRAMGMSADAASEGTLSEEEIVGILAANAARSPGGKAEGRARRARRSASPSAPRATRWCRASTSSRSRSRTTGEEAVRQLRTHQYSRVVLTKEQPLDEIAGYLYAKDFLVDPAAAKLHDARRASGATSSSCPRRRACSTCSATCSARRPRSPSSSTSTAARAAS